MVILSTRIQIHLVQLVTCFIAIARHAVTVLALVKVFTASLAVGSVTIGRTVEAVAAVSGRVVKRLVKVAPTRESVTVASCRYPTHKKKK